jgi:hypothetical protein
MLLLQRANFTVYKLHLNKLKFIIKKKKEFLCVCFSHYKNILPSEEKNKSEQVLESK